MRRAVLLFAASALVACSPAPKKSEPQSKAVQSEAQSIGHTPKPVKTASPAGPLLFHGYACGSDCKGHEQGYSWAANHQISNPMDCRGTSETFIEGCRAFTGIDGPLGVREIFQDED